VLDSIQVPLLTEAAAQALAGWTQVDLFMNRRDTLKLALGAPLILAAERMLGGTSRALNDGRKGFDADTVTALEEVTAFFAKADASKGGGLYRSAIVAQLAEVARRIQDAPQPVYAGHMHNMVPKPSQFRTTGTKRDMESASSRVTGSRNTAARMGIASPRHWTTSAPSGRPSAAAYGAARRAIKCRSARVWAPGPSACWPPRRRWPCPG
jgi:hypothetical protein